MIKRYYIPSTLDEALKLKSQNPYAVWMAGGTQINRLPQEAPRPEVFIDVRRAVPSGVKVENGFFVIGANTSLQDIADNTQLPRALSDAAGFIPSRSIRNQATIGGNICAFRSDSYILPVLLALEARLLSSRGEVPLENFLSRLKEYRGTTVDAGLGNPEAAGVPEIFKTDELLIEIRIPESCAACVAIKEARSAMALPVVSGAVCLWPSPDGSGIQRAGVIMGSSVQEFRHLEGVEKAIVAGKLKARDELEKAIMDAVHPPMNFQSSVAYRKYISGVTGADAVLRCREVLGC